MKPAVRVSIKVLREGAIVPQYQTNGAAGFDLHACIDEPIVIQPGERKLVGTGLAVYIGNPMLALYVMPRSGLAMKHGIGLANDVGLVDSDYQGELGALLQNRGEEPFVVNHRDRIAQGVIGPVLQANFIVVDEFVTSTQRGAGGFGSTGTGEQKLSA
jgi:dUTP pyrophosphatase